MLAPWRAWSWWELGSPACCAIRLAEAGPHFLLARDLPLETTSVVAAALWYPYKASCG